MTNYYHQKNKLKKILATIIILALHHREVIPAIVTTPV
jgi:hypothetical protein